MGEPTAAQDVYLRLIRASGEWNAFNGPSIEASLRAHTGLWRSVILTREVMPGARSQGLFSRAKAPGLAEMVDLIVLRDLPKDLVNLDTLFILAEPGRQSELEELANGWEADEVGWIGAADACRAMGDSANANQEYAVDAERVILRVWWD